MKGAPQPAGPATGVPPGYRGPGSFEAVPVPPDGYVPGRFVTHRTLDPVRAAALTAAVHHSRWLDVDANPDHVGAVLAVAERFEAYLAGEGADGET
jgi:hypothetical protein